MTIEELSFAVGLHAAAKLQAPKARLGDTPEIRAAETDYDGSPPTIGKVADICPCCGEMFPEGMIH